MAVSIPPEKTTRAEAYKLWMKAPNPMVTFFKELDVTNLLRVSKRKKLKFNMPMDYCIGKAAADIKEFYLLPVGDQLIKYDSIAINTLIKNRDGGIRSCDISYSVSLEEFNREYLKYTAIAADGGHERDLKVFKETIQILAHCFVSISSYADGWCACRKIFEKSSK